jgi:hypothetical protein
MHRKFNEDRTFENFDQQPPTDYWTGIEDCQRLYPSTGHSHRVECKRFLWVCFPQFCQLVEAMPAPRDAFRAFMAPLGVDSGIVDYFKQLDATWRLSDLWQAAQSDHETRPEAKYGFQLCSETDEERKQLVDVIDTFKRDALTMTLRWFNGTTGYETEIVHVSSLSLYERRNEHWFVRVRFNWPRAKDSEEVDLVAATLTSGQYLHNSLGKGFSGSLTDDTRAYGDLLCFFGTETLFAYDHSYGGMVPKWIKKDGMATRPNELEAMLVEPPSLERRILEETFDVDRWLKMPRAKKRAFLQEMGLDITGTLAEKRPREDEDDEPRGESKRPRFMRLGE